MRRGSGEPATRSDGFLVAGCTALALIALVIPRSWGLGIAAGLRQTALRPIVAMQARAAQDRTSRFRLSSLQREHDSLAILVQQQEALRRENATLRAIDSLRPRITNRTVAAEVLHRPTMTDSRMLLLDVGSNDGVQSFDPIVTAEGLVGYIVGVGGRSSSALTIDNADFAASAETVDGRVRGFVHPAPQVSLSAPALELRGVALRDSLPVGTIVVTTGAGGTFPRGIPIGRVVAIEREVYGYDRVYRVVPFTNPDDVSHVVVLVSPRDTIFPMPPSVVQPRRVVPAVTAPDSVH